MNHKKELLRSLWVCDRLCVELRKEAESKKAPPREVLGGEL